jgi:uncharacterized protein
MVHLKARTAHSHNSSIGRDAARKQKKPVINSELPLINLPRLKVPLHLMNTRMGVEPQCQEYRKDSLLMSEIIAFVLLGVLAGVFSGLIGLGGGIIIVPALMFLFGMTQHQAQGTTLALLVPPIGLLAAWVYYKQGYVNLKAAAIICAGFVLGSFIGARFATQLSDEILQRVFGVALLAIGIKMIFFK